MATPGQSEFSTRYIDAASGNVIKEETQTAGQMTQQGETVKGDDGKDYVAGNALFNGGRAAIIVKES